LLHAHYAHAGVLGAASLPPLRHSLTAYVLWTGSAFWAQQVGSYPGYTSRNEQMVGKAAHGPLWRLNRTGGLATVGPR
jgi:hypothetical protein